MKFMMTENTDLTSASVCVIQTQRCSQSEAVALQAIRNAKGNDLCVDCDAPCKFFVTVITKSHEQSREICV